MGLDTTATDLVQAVLEGMAFRAAEGVSTMDGYVSIDGTLSIDGGVSSNPDFCQFSANLLGRNVLVRKSVELTALGCAMLASDLDIVSDCYSTQSILYTPQTVREEWRHRFGEAIERCKQWR